MVRSAPSSECPNCSSQSPSSSSSSPSTSYPPLDRKLNSSSRRGRSKSGGASGKDSSNISDRKQGKGNWKAPGVEGRGDGNAQAAGIAKADKASGHRDSSLTPSELKDELQAQPDAGGPLNIDNSSSNMQPKESAMDGDVPCSDKRRNEIPDACSRVGLRIGRALGTFIVWCRVHLATIYRQQKPNLDAFGAAMSLWSRKLQLSALRAWPPLRVGFMIVGSIALTLGIMWFDCTLSGLRSLFRLGSTALFLLLCSIIMNLGILAGVLKLFVALVLSFAAAFFFGYLPAIAVFGIFSGAILWLYGSFWFTGGIVFVGGFLFVTDKPRLAILVGLLYSTYSAKKVGGWFGLFLCMNMAFISSNLMVYFVHSNGTESDGRGFGTGASQGEPNGTSKQGGSSDASNSRAMSEGASTSGVEASAVDKEVERVLSCKDHYAVLGLGRFDEVDGAVLKRDYRKKAMLVHPDKNLGNTVAEEAFKRLQNAYEVLLDPSKKQCYDDELKKEEVIAALKRFQQEVFRNGRFGTSESRCPPVEDESDGGSRRIVCKKCSDTHLWACTDRDKLRARWCQECQDYHPAKDGDGWVEQLGHVFFFGMFRKVDVPRAYACADSKVYEVTEWVQCQGMKCPPNTHKPSFHVSTAGMMKGGASRGAKSSKGSAAAAAAADGFSFAHLNENMTEEEFIKWLENAMASGMFHNDINDAPPCQGKAESHAKPSRKKRKGKNKW